MINGKYIEMKKILYIMGVVLAMASCTQSDTTEIESSAAVFSTSSALTRVTSSAASSTWQTGDEIGISSDNDDSNVKYTATCGESTTTFTYSDTEQKQIVLPRMSKVSYSAYYPYQTTENYSSDISNQSNLGKIDFLVASDAEGIEDGGNVEFSFKHALSMIYFTITLNEEFSDNIPEDEEVDLSEHMTISLDDLATQATYSRGGEYQQTTQTGSISLVISDATATAIINPITNNSTPVEQSLALTVTFDSEIFGLGVYTYTMTLTPQANYIYKYNIIFGNGTISVGKSPKILDWTDYDFDQDEDTIDYEYELGSLSGKTVD